MNSTSSHEQVSEISDQNFEERVLKATRPVVVDFTADWCPPCRALAPVYHRLSAEFAGRLDFASLDFDDNTRIGTLLGVQALPTLIVFHQGREVARQVGPRPARLKMLLEDILHENGLA